MGSGYASLRATGSTPKMAIERLMMKIGAENYRLSHGDRELKVWQTTPTLYETNVLVTASDWARTPQRAGIAELWDANRGVAYYEASFYLPM